MKIQNALSLLAAAAALAVPALAGAEDDGPGLVELVEILKKEGVLDDAQYAQVIRRAGTRDRERRASWLDRIELSGDLRARYENFLFQNKNATGVRQTDRHRGRYRARLNVKGHVNDHIQAFLRIASGDDDSRSANQTLGSGVDFGADPIQIRRAYLRLSPFAGGELPDGRGALAAEVGKVPNPFVWRVGRDILLWDHDISPEGLNLSLEKYLSEDLELFSDAGIYVIDENGASRDVKLAAAQSGGHWQATPALRVGGRFAWFGFLDADPAFITRASTGAGGVTGGGGNVPGGLNGDGNDFHVLAGTAYVTCGCVERWPVTLYGTVANNLDADSALGVGERDLAWSIGLALGDKEEFFELGVLYGYVEANAFPSQFIDSDLLDGFTNREGFSFHIIRRILENTDLRLEILRSRWLAQSADPLGVSVPNGNRIRMRLDLSVAF